MSRLLAAGGMAVVSRVLVVEDDPAVGRALSITLRARRYDVAVAHDGSSALAVLSTQPPDVVLLDLGLPDIDGVDVLRALRNWTSVPVVVLSARVDSSDKVAALDAGADDYVTKPFVMEELLARLRAATRRREANPSSPVVVTAGFTIDLPRRQVLRDGAAVKVTPTEWNLLTELARTPDQVVTHSSLLQALRGHTLDRESHYLRVYMAQLRRKLEVDPAHPRHLVSEPGVGYRLVT